MSDNFLYRINEFDHQLQGWSNPSVERMHEATARALVKNIGALPAAIVMQRIADTCAVEQLMPIAHWQTSAPVKQPVKRSRVRAFADWINLHCLHNRTFILIVSFCAGWWWGIFTR